MREAFPRPPSRDQLSDEEQRIFNNCELLGGGGLWEPLSPPSPFVTMHIKHAPAQGTERSLAFGKAAATIDCSPRFAAAYWFIFESRESTQISNSRATLLAWW